MANLNMLDDSHEQESPESRYMLIFWPAFLNAATKANLTGNEVGDDYFSFKDGGKTITITIKVK